MDMAREPLNVGYWKRRLETETHMHAAALREKDLTIRDQANRIRALELELHGLREVNKFMEGKLFPPPETLRQIGNVYPPPSRPALPAIGYEPQGVNRQDTFVVTNGLASGFNGQDQHEQRPARSWTPGQNVGQSTVQTAGNHHQTGSMTSAMTPSPEDHRDQDRGFSRSRLLHRNGHEDEDDEAIGGMPHLPIQRQVLEDEEDHRIEMANGYDREGYGDHHDVDEREQEDLDFGEEEEEDRQEPPPRVAAKRARPASKRTNDGGNRRKAPAKKSKESSNGQKKQPVKRTRSSAPSASKSRRTASSNRSSAPESEPEQEQQQEEAVTSSSGRKLRPAKRFDSADLVPKKKTPSSSRKSKSVESEDGGDADKDDEGPPTLAVNNVASDDEIREDDPEEEDAAAGGDGDHDTSGSGNDSGSATAFKPHDKLEFMHVNVFDKFKCIHRRCADEDKIFQNRKRAADHNRIHIQEQTMPFRCEPCGRGYESAEHLKRHIKCKFAPKVAAGGREDEDDGGQDKEDGNEAAGDTASEV